MITSAIELPSKKYRRKATVFAISAGLIAAGCIYTGFNPIGFFTEFHYVRDLIGEMMWPNFEILWANAALGRSLLQTVSMAFLGTLYGGTISVILAFLGASNTMPSAAVRNIAKICLGLVRVIPALVVILIFVLTVGIGPFSGVLTLTIITVGIFGKLFTETLENSEQGPSEAIYSAGASRVQVIRYSIIPQILPSFIANMLYAFDVNVRAAIGLGIFGAGGIGFDLHLSMRVLHYKDATAYICIIIVLAMLVEKLSDFLRRKILSEGKL